MNRYRVFFDDQRTPIDVAANVFKRMSHFSDDYEFTTDCITVATFHRVRAVVNLENLRDQKFTAQETTIEDVAKKEISAAR